MNVWSTEQCHALGQAKRLDDYDMGRDHFIEKFDRYYTVRMRNYPVQEEYLNRDRCIETEAGI